MRSSSPTLRWSSTTRIKWSSLDEVEVDMVDGSEEDGLDVDDLAQHPRNDSDADSDDD
jgi:hypothetical protein